MIEKLTWRRADINKETKNGDTPLLLAAMAGSGYTHAKLFPMVNFKN